jgi:hypothetical protein
VALVSPALTVSEAAGTAQVAVTVSGTHTRTLTVTVSTLAGTATSDDFLPVTGTLSFAPGQSTRTFSVTVIDDPLEENAETFEVRLSAPVNALLGSPAVATVTIVDDDRRQRLYLPLMWR